MRKIFFIILLFSNFFLFAQQKLNSAQQEAFKIKTKEKNQNIQNLQADFTQKKHLDFLAKDIETSGKLAFEKPNKLNWQYTKPYAYRIVFQKDKISIDDDGNVSEIKNDNKIFKKINQLIINSVSGNMFDDKEFAVELYHAGNKVLAKLSPKDKTLLKYTKEIHLLFAPDATVDNVKLIEPSGDYTEIIFKNKTINGKLDTSAFHI
ncbi:MAG: outer membrane lipoprotein carrier protein LolA [Capnocytophaga sp.]|nr:outer membrane lipoprotein carrier protein LolA [Capnocytophaga sp.]